MDIGELINFAIDKEQGLKLKRMGDGRGKNINPDNIYYLFKIVGNTLKEEGQKYFLLSGDARKNTKTLMQAAIEGLEKYGVSVLDMGEKNTTPQSEKTRKKLGVSGAMITASHQGAEYNGVKIELEIAPDETKTEQQLKEARKHEHRNKIHYDIKELSDRMYMEEMTKKFENIKIPSKLKIVYDALQGTSAHNFSEIATKLGIRFELNRERPDPSFYLTVGGPDPINPRNLGELHELIYDVALISDGDGDRLISATKKEGLIHSAYFNLLRAEHNSREKGQNAFVAEHNLRSIIKDELEKTGIKTYGARRGRINLINMINDLNLHSVSVSGGAEISGHNFNDKGFDDSVENALEFIDYLGSLEEKNQDFKEIIRNAEKRTRAFVPEIRFATLYHKEELYEKIMDAIPGIKMVDGPTYETNGFYINFRESANDNSMTINPNAKSKAELRELLDYTENKVRAKGLDFIADQIKTGKAYIRGGK